MSENPEDQERLYRAEQAKRIMDEELVKTTLHTMRTDALEALARVASDDQISILRLQSQISVVDGFCEQFEAIILDADEMSRSESSVV